MGHGEPRWISTAPPLRLRRAAAPRRRRRRAPAGGAGAAHRVSVAPETGWARALAHWPLAAGTLCVARLLRGRAGTGLGPLAFAVSPPARPLSTKVELLWMGGIRGQQEGLLLPIGADAIFEACLSSP